MAQSKGGRPSRGTPADRRLQENKPDASKPKPKPKPAPKQDGSKV